MLLPNEMEAAGECWDLGSYSYEAPEHFSGWFVSSTVTGCLITRQLVGKQKPPSLYFLCLNGYDVLLVFEWLST